MDQQFNLRGLITVKDIQKAIKYPNACKDSLGRLRVGAAVGIAEDASERAEALVAANVDVLVLDSAHGHSQNVIDTAARLRRAFPAGGSDRRQPSPPAAGCGRWPRRAWMPSRVGIGSGSICTTRIIAGIGVPMVTAVAECASAAAEYDIPSSPTAASAIPAT